jgi:hypothetical protein
MQLLVLNDHMLSLFTQGSISSPHILKLLLHSDELLITLTYMPIHIR